MTVNVLKDEYLNWVLLKNWYSLQKLREYYRKKIIRIHNNVANKPSNLDIKLNIKGYRKKWRALNKHVNPYWYKTFSYASGIEDINYVPEDLFYGIIEPTLNNFAVAMTYSDKNSYDRLFSDMNIFPETILRNMGGLFYNSNYEYWENLKPIEYYLGDEQKVIVKPAIESGGGKNVQIFYKESNKHYYNKSGEKLDCSYLLKNYNRNFLIQKCIKQKSYFHQFNDSSLNTMRIYTYRSVNSDDVLISNCVLRIGQKGTEIDNVSLGGIFCFIDKNGKLSDYAMDSHGNKHFSLPWNNNFKFSETEKIPEYNKITKFAKKIAKKNYYQRLLGLDICIDKYNNIRLIEINNEECEINGFQMFGSSIFKEYTDEIIEFLKKENGLEISGNLLEAVSKCQKLKNELYHNFLQKLSIRLFSQRSCPTKKIFIFNIT